MKGTVFIFVQLITAIFCGHCPAGFLWHQNVSKCCQPITHCEPDHQVKPCLMVGKADYCAPCPKGETNSFNTSSFDMKACKPNTCSSDTTPGKNGKCVCNLLKGYTGEDPKLCLNEGKRCPKGTELKLDGECKPCAFGHYKDWEGYGFCKKQINCGLLQLEYKEYGNSQTAAICKKQQTDYKISDGSKQRNESNTLSVRHPMMAITEKSELRPITEHALKSEHSKNNLLPKKNLFACDLQIIVVVLGVLLFISSMLIVYLIITKKPTSRQVKTSLPSKTTISDVDWCNKRNQRPLPILPRQRTYSTSEDSQYIPMNASRHPSCSSTNIQAFKQQDIKDDWMCHGKDPYNIPSPLNESAYVKIEPLSLDYLT